MIKNVVFDMGNVILSYNPQYIIEHFTSDSQIQALLINEIFKSKEWLALDEGTITLEYAIEAMKSRIPSELSTLVEQVMKDWYLYLPPIQGMDKLIKDLKGQGLHIYLLSNTSLSFYQYYSNLDIFKLFDGLYISAKNKLLKPDPNIFKHFIQTFELNAEECFFVDDIDTNIQSAKSIGMHGLCFNGNHDSPEIIKKAIS